MDAKLTKKCVVFGCVGRQQGGYRSKIRILNESKARELNLKQASQKHLCYNKMTNAEPVHQRIRHASSEEVLPVQWMPDDR